MADDEVGPIIYKGRDIAFNPATVSAKVRAEADLLHVEEPVHDKSSCGPSFTPITLAWRGLNFDVPQKRGKGRGKGIEAASVTTESELSAGLTDKAQEPPDMTAIPGGEDGPNKRVLHNCTGIVRPGEMLAVLGSSGAGKSTFLNLLAGRLKSSKDCVSSGEILVNDSKRDFDTYRKLAAFVEQDDQMFATLTVEEQIRYTALMRLSSAMSKEAKLLKVEAIIQELGLSKCRNTVIGNQLVKGVSGGERKRTSIGTELVTEASLLLCDEPTTGLDAFSALNVISTLRHLASTGRTVVATIHQPRSSIFSQFDKLLVLSEGRTVYFGLARDAAAHFASIGFRSPPHFNFADYIIDAVTIDYRSRELETRTKKRVLYLANEHAARYEQHHSGDGEMGSNVRSDDGPQRLRPVAANDGFQNTVFAEFAILLRRGIVKLSRDRLTLTSRLFETVVFAVVLGVIWLNAGRGDEKISTLRSIQGVLFFLVVNQTLDGSFAVIFDIPLERAVLSRERSSGSYRIWSYWIASATLDMCKATFLNLLSVSIVYWMVGLRSNFGAYAFLVVTTIILAQTGEAYTQLISVLTADPQIITALVPLALILAFLFAGLLILPEAMPAYIAWGSFLSFLYWGYQGAGHNEFSERTDKSELEEQILEDFNNASRWGNLAICAGFLLFFKGLYFAALWYKGPKFDKRL